LKKKRKSLFPSGIHQGTERLPKKRKKEKQTNKTTPHPPPQENRKNEKRRTTTRTRSMYPLYRL
jgi:hypothetical protein